MQRIRFRASSPPAVLALTTIVAYGLLLPWTGFYWDDWPFAWIARFQGPAEFFPAFQGFRPFLAPIFYLTTSIMPASPVAWQVAALVVRFLAAWAVWWSLRRIWPSQPSITVASALLFLVFPGYSQHWVALTHINQEWISLIAYVLSIGISIGALRDAHDAVRSTSLALALQVIGLLPTEYFSTLEPLRALVFWSILSQSEGDRARRARMVLRAWWPYAVVWLLNGIWLYLYYRSGAYVSYDVLGTTTAVKPLDVLAVFADALLKAGAYVWVQFIPLASASLRSPATVASWSAAIIAAAGLAFYLTRLHDGGSHGDNGNAAARRRAAWSGIALGLCGIVLGRVPSFAAALPLTLQSSFDRLTISLMLPAALFLAGALHLLFARAAIRAYTLAALLGLGVGQQAFNANIFRRDWTRQQDIYWQFAWRMPAIEPDTAILTQQMPLDYETDLGMTAAINWIFAPTPQAPHLPYAVLYTEKRLGGTALPSLDAGIPIRLPLRTMMFEGSTSRVITVYVPQVGCLRVFDPNLGDVQTYSHLPEPITAAIPRSNPDLIVVDAPMRSVPSPPFAAEPEHGWCYIYERAELARQAGDWESIIKLHVQASDAGAAPEDLIEWLPFVEAEARVGDSMWATEQSAHLLLVQPKLQRGLCAAWGRVQLQDAGTDSQARQVRTELACE